MSLFVLKDEFIFQIPALEIFPKTWGGGGGEGGNPI